MPCSYHFIGDRVLVCVFAGHYTIEETLANFKAGLDDPQADGGAPVIIDVTASDTVKSAEDFRRVVQELRRHPNFGGHIATVASLDDPIRYGVSRQFASLTSLEGVPMEVRNSVSDALSWLMRQDIDPDPAKRVEQADTS